MSLRQRSIPAPGEAPLPAPSVAELLRRHAHDPSVRDRPAVLFGETTWTYREYFAECCRFANLLHDRMDPDRPPHVAVLADNTPDYLFAFGGAAMIGAAVVGLNHTRRGEHLLRDIEHTHCQLVVTEPRHEALLEPIGDRVPPVLTSSRFAAADDPSRDLGASLEDALGGVSSDDVGRFPRVDSICALIFTSGTSSAPKAVICTQRRLLVTGNRMTMVMDIGPDDVTYVCMPLFHSNAVMVGWAPAIVAGSAVALARRFSVSSWLPDVRRYGATRFHYTGKPLAYLVSLPETPEDSDNPLAVAFGNEGSPEVVAEFSRRFGVEVIDAYGATEGGIAVSRDAAERAGALGVAPDHVQIVDEDGNQLPRARFDDAGHLANADECVGEIVNTAGAGPFEGYYNNPEATERTTRKGWYWSGDLGYKDDDGYLYFAGRTADWIRVDGENFPAGPLEEALREHPDVVVAAVYGVPDDQAGDQVMAGLVLRDGASFDGEEFATWLDACDDIGPKWRPRYLRILQEPPTTGTFKIVKRSLVHDKWRTDRVSGDRVLVRERGEPTYRPFTPEDESGLRESFRRYQRSQFWDL